MYTGWIKNPSPAWPDSVITTNLASFNAYVMIALYVSANVLRAVQADETGANPVSIDSLVSLADGGWHFFAVWFDDADKKLRLSVDLETAVASAAMTGNYKTYTGASNFYIGSATGTTDAWDGNIARVGYYSTAGSDAIRTSLYNSGKGKSYADLTTAEKVGLVSYWNLDEASGDRADSHGSNTLTDNNTVGSATNSYPANLPGRVANFVAANSEYLSAPDDGAGLSIDGDHSFSVWFYSTGTGTNRAIISQRTAGDGAYQLYLDTSDQLHAYVTDSVSGFSEPVRAGAIADNGWHLAIMTYTASDKKLRLYLDDGSETAGSALSNGPVSSTQDFNVVRLASVIYGSIRLSSLGAWSRVLTPEERAALFNSGNGAPLP